jgi:cation transport regulator ChaB
MIHRINGAVIRIEEETAHRVAWDAVKKKYAKDGNGEWKQKDDS